MTVVATNAVEDLEQLADLARRYMNADRAANTTAGYSSDWAQFEQWCSDRSLVALPADPAVLGMYLADRAGILAVATLERHRAAIADRHRRAGFDSPTRHPDVQRQWRGIRRTFGTAKHGKAPVRARDLRSMIAELDTTTTIGLRDRALLVIGFGGAFRRSELAGLDVADIEETPDGLVVRLGRSKTDQLGEGARVALPWGSSPDTCPVRTLRAWLLGAGITEGPVFRPVDRHGNVAERRLADRAITAVVKRHAEAVGLDASRIGAHSLRAGFITSAVEGGAHERNVMRQSRHQSLTVFRSYVRDVGLFDDHPAAAVGL